jgi:hypothetical protein
VWSKGKGTCSSSGQGRYGGGEEMSTAEYSDGGLRLGRVPGEAVDSTVPLGRTAGCMLERGVWEWKLLQNTG